MAVYAVTLTASDAVVVLLKCDRFQSRLHWGETKMPARWGDAIVLDVQFHDVLVLKNVITLDLRAGMNGRAPNPAKLEFFHIVVVD